MPVNLNNRMHAGYEHNLDRHIASGGERRRLTGARVSRRRAKERESNAQIISDRPYRHRRIYIKIKLSGIGIGPAEQEVMGIGLKKSISCIPIGNHGK